MNQNDNHEIQRQLKRTNPDLTAGTHAWWDAFRNIAFYVGRHRKDA